MSLPRQPGGRVREASSRDARLPESVGRVRGGAGTGYPTARPATRPRRVRGCGSTRAGWYGRIRMERVIRSPVALALPGCHHIVRRQVAVAASDRPVLVPNVHGAQPGKRSEVVGAPPERSHMDLLPSRKRLVEAALRAVVVVGGEDGLHRPPHKTGHDLTSGGARQDPVAEREYGIATREAGHEPPTLPDVGPEGRHRRGQVTEVLEHLPRDDQVEAIDQTRCRRLGIGHDELVVRARRGRLELRTRYIEPD